VRKVADLLAQALTLYFEGHLLGGVVASFPIVAQSYDRYFLSAGSDLGDRNGSLEPAVPIRRTSEIKRRFLLDFRPVESGDTKSLRRLCLSALARIGCICRCNSGIVGTSF